MNAFAIQTPVFDGPLDLLLSMVRHEELSIADLPLAPITAQYLAYIEAADTLDVNLGMEWIEMAARLIQWKSASLLPRDPSLPDPGVELREELVRGLKALAGPRSWSSPNSGPLRDDMPSGEEIPASLWTVRKKARALREAFERRRNAPDTAYAIEADSVSVEEMRLFALRALEQAPAGVWFSSSDWLDLAAPRSRKIYLFLALLDLATAGIIRLDEDTAAEYLRICRV